METQYIKDDNGKTIGVFLPIGDYKEMLERLEELNDIRLYDEVKSKGEEIIPLDDYLAQGKSKPNG